MIKKLFAFYKVLFALFVISAALIWCGLQVAWDYLADYEASLPDTLIAQVFTAYEEQNLAPYKAYFSDVADLSQLEDVVDKDTIFLYCSKHTANSVVYQVINDGYKLSEITLATTEKLSPKGFQQYEIQSIESFPTTTKIQMPADGVLTINGKEVDFSQAQDMTKHSLIDGDSYQIANFTVLGYEPVEDISISLDGLDCDITETEDGYSSVAAISPEDEEIVTDVATLFTKSYMQYATKRNVSRYTVLKYVVPDTYLADFITSYSNIWGERCIDESFPKLEITNLTKMGENLIQCDVSALYHIVLDSEHEQESPFEYQLLIRLDGDTGLVEQMERGE